MLDVHRALLAGWLAGGWNGSVVWCVQRLWENTRLELAAVEAAVLASSAPDAASSEARVQELSGAVARLRVQEAELGFTVAVIQAQAAVRMNEVCACAAIV